MQVPRDGLVAKLQKLSQSQQSIESVSSFCVFYHKDARGVVNIWEEEFFKAPNDRKMALLYLANHILQEGRRKGTGFQDEFYRVLPKAMQHALGGGDERVKRAVSRLVAIWEERRVFGTRHIKSFQGLELPISGDLAAVTTISGHLEAYESALQRELDSRRAAVAALQSAVRAQEEAVAAAAAQLGACGAQREQLRARMGQLSAGLVAGLQGLPGIAGLGGPAAPAAAPASASVEAPPPPPPAQAPAAAVGSPEAPAMEVDMEDDYDDDGAALTGLEGTPEQQRSAAAASGGGYTAAPAPAPAAAPPLLADALSKLPEGERDRLGFDLEALMNSGLLAGGGNGAGAAVAGTAGGGGGGYGDGAFADEGDDPYDPEDPF
ncbi:Regulation of nuclear pre-mRNA domain-containing protein 1B [Monoraphidium neglectum]|uniref:Regulation of nuclear pre-mRNA domain-containing protein 1B n=1 Tax=Monoraphidium neglectum TaxID=145388 RepID=A0A0D2NG44_9CHLO|nr:Regulation of nuclear pre-mRNA domain-containing protein 1B [Monoraphidium neglectum]KIZ04036.1 Regulation of nuclear pre-mRNA domain-containing protein 1B [Monoraphidium neglectum]|eukprot:XP_013903055.1 Regulation of nuclear pre-mRNA domain-containing protein 1B [Monoraphidium neglectum]